MLIIRSFAVWLLIIGVESLHGILRNLLLAPLVGELPARQLSVLTGSVLIFALSYLCIRWMAARTTLQLIAVGLMWVIWTVLFEVSLGRLVLSLPWDRITEDYDVSRGGFLGFGLLFMALTPWLTMEIHGLTRN